MRNGGRYVWWLLLAGAGAATVFGCGGAAKVRQPSAAGREGHGMQLSAGEVGMNGKTEVACALSQNDRGEVDLRMTVKARCDTESGLDVQTEWRSAAGLPLSHGTHRFLLDATLAADERRSLRAGPFALPPAGAILVTEVTATCSGPASDRVWSRARCRVPE